jgi:tRNA-dihydrouridine synthase
LQFTDPEQPIFAQIWGKNPDNYYKIARQIVDGTIQREIENLTKQSGLSKMQGDKEKRASRIINTASEHRTQSTQQFAKTAGGVASLAGEQAIAARMFGGFSGIDINMGCPDKSVIKNGGCSALINNRQLAAEIIAATKQGVAGKVPVSVKIRTGFNEVDFSWPRFILEQDIDLLTVHGRTTKEMSKVPNRWADIAKVREIRDEIAPETQIIGNGDVLSRKQGEELAKKHKLDGIMIGRGVFSDPYVLGKASKWQQLKPAQKAALYKKHIELFVATWQDDKRNFQGLKKFAKMYLNGFEDAGNIRSKLVRAQSVKEMIEVLDGVT